MKSRCLLALTILVLIPLGLGTKFYSGPGRTWVHHYAGDIFYPMFWFFVVMFLMPKAKPLFVALFVFLFSTAIECTQLLDTSFLSFLRQSFIGRTLVGTSFAWMDILYYGVGCVLAVFLYRKLQLKM